MRSLQSGHGNGSQCAVGEVAWDSFTVTKVKDTKMAEDSY